MTVLTWQSWSWNRKFLRGYPLLPLFLLLGLSCSFPRDVIADDAWQIGVAQVEITPPLGFPISGYYHERLATGTADPLWAKGLYIRQGDTEFAWVSCDLTGLATDLSVTVREQATKRTGIPAHHIVLSATHSHTAPDYYKALYLSLGPDSEVTTDQDRQRVAYARQLVDSIATAVVQAKENARPGILTSGAAKQETQVSYCRRSVMRDGSVRTWVGLKHPDAIRTSAPIDPDIGLLKIQRPQSDAPAAIISNFALHLDTVGGTQWSGDYPYAIEQAVRKAFGPDVFSLFGTGCCGDINHNDPHGEVRRNSLAIGGELGQTIVAATPQLTEVPVGPLQVRHAIVPLPLEEVSPAELQHSVDLLQAVDAGQKIDFYDHVRAYKRMMLNHLVEKDPHPAGRKFLSAGLSRTLQGGGETLPTEVSVATFGQDVALVFLPGEIFTELGLAIKQASPFRTTFIVELSNGVETFYVPNQHAYAGGGYEPTNSLVQPGSGERLVEAAVTLLRKSAEDVVRQQAENRPEQTR